MTNSLCVFCGASNNVPQEYFDLGAELGRRMVERNIQLVYGGGDCGIMGAVANGVMKHKGYALGVFPLSLKNIEHEHQNLSEIIIVDTMHQRKQIMYQRSDAFVILPGGFGTMDEMFEILTWKQLQLHTKPIVILNHNGYWDHLVSLMDGIITRGFAAEKNRTYYKVVNTIDELLDVLQAEWGPTA
jgi:uncharacterized protein (TIGR00730 family)